MKIYVDKIPEQGLELSGQIEPGSLSLDTESISFVKPIEVNLKAVKATSELFVDVRLEAPVEYTCSKCLSKFQDVLRKEFSISRKVRAAEIVEIDEDIRQEIMLDYPMKIMCRSDCKGLCPNCGQNLNVGECECIKT